MLLIFLSLTHSLTPSYAGITLDFTILVTIEYGVTFTVDLCVLGMNVAAEARPFFKLAVTAGVKISFFIIRAGVEIKCTIIEHAMPITPSIHFDNLPVQSCINMDAEIKLLTVEVSIVVEFRDKIKCES